MATPVPYEGAPDRVPGQEGISPINTSANPAAFGVNLAEATGHLGQVIEGSGKELFDRAYAMQELQVHADVNARLADAQNQMMNKFVDFSQLEGKNAVDGLPKFQSDIDGIRQKAGDGLSPIGQEFYDQESRQSRYRLSFAGAEHAAGQQKAYVSASADAQVSTASKMMEVNPNDPATAEKSLQTIRDAVKFKVGDIAGMSDDVVKAKQADAVNAAVQGRIRSMAKDDPMGAQKLFDQATKDGDLYGNDATNLSWYIKNQQNTVGARVVSSQAFDALRNTGGPVLQALFKNESGGSLTVENPQSTTSGHAQGAFQITTGTWHEFAGKAGIDLAAYPDAKSAPYAVQAQMAGVIPLKRWDHTTIEAMQRAGGKLDPNATLADNLRANGEGLGAAAGQKDPTLQELTDKTKAIAEAHFPGDEDFAERAVDHTIAQYNKEKQIVADTDHDNQQSVWNTLLNGVGPNKQIPTSVAELKLDPKAAEAWDQLNSSHPSDLKPFLNQMASNAKGDVAMTTERLQSWQNLSGMAVNDPQQFMAKTADISTLDLPIKEKLGVLSMRQSIYKKQDANPQVGAALATINRLNMLAPLGLTKAENPSGLATFTGVLSDAMTQFQQTHNKPMSDDDIKTAAQQLLSPVGGKHFWSSQQPWFESIDSVPDEAAESIKQELQSRGTPVTDAAVLSNYLAAQYQELFGKTQSRPVK